jgi:hypothetical protein
LSPVREALAWLIAAVLLPAAVAAQELPPLFPDAAPMGSEAPRGDIESYSSKTLWEKINGEAELFRRFGVIRAAFAHYEHPNDIDRTLELAVYSFPDNLSAFGLFATFSSADDPREELGNGAVIGSYQGYLWHGSFFVTADAFGSPEVRAATLKWALSQVVSTLGPVPPVPLPLKAFGKAAEPATISYRPDHLLGREIFPSGLEGSLANGTRIFTTIEKTAAADVLAAYRTLLENPKEARHGDATLLSGVDPLLGKVTVMARGERLAGARALPDEEGLLEVLLGLLRSDP